MAITLHVSLGGGGIFRIGNQLQAFQQVLLHGDSVAVYRACRLPSAQMGDRDVLDLSYSYGLMEYCVIDSYCFSCRDDEVSKVLGRQL
jgi:hypothetical protein